MGAIPVIPCISTRKIQIAYDRTAYKARNAVERTFGKLKHFCRFATRDDRRDTYFLAFILFAATMPWSRWMSVRPSQHAAERDKKESRQRLRASIITGERHGTGRGRALRGITTMLPYLKGVVSR